ncbi:MAG: hypothetical protein BAW33_04500 [Desulfobacterales bacterium C00003104]|nr:MAG: hypothetical protein BAW33_04500 [Desulfobacterales bacterium C00003104]
MLNQQIMRRRFLEQKLLFSKSLFSGIVCLFSFFLAFDIESVPAQQPGKAVKINVVAIIVEDYDGITLSHPSSLFYDPFRRETYVVDSGNSRIVIYTHDFFPLTSIGKTRGIESPSSVALDSAGNLFVTQSPSAGHPNGRLSVLSASLKWKGDIRFEGFDGAQGFVPQNIAINNHDSLYITGTDYPNVVVLNKDGTLSHILSTADTVRDKSVNARITDVEIDDRGRIYLLSEDMGRIYVYDAQEKFLLKFGQKGGGAGKLSRPRGLSVDSDKKRVYCVDYMRHSVSAYSLEGQYLFEFGGLGWSKGWMQFPSGICVNREGYLLVADTFNHRIQVFEITPIKE